MGEKVTWTSTPSNFTTTGTESDWTGATITLSAGVWSIFANVNYTMTTGATAGNDVVLELKITDSANAVIQNFYREARVKTVANLANSLTSTLSFAGVVSVASSTTYKIRARRNDVSGTNSATLYNQGPYSEFFAIRIA